METSLPAEEAKATALLECDRRRTLIVDDEKEIVRLFHMILGTELPDLVIDEAYNGAEAVDAFSEGHHAVLILDLHMPVMDGQASFGRIQELCRTRNWQMPSVVFCTGYAPPDLVTRAVREEGAHCLLSKPVSGDDIVRAVRTRLGHRLP